MAYGKEIFWGVTMLILIPVIMGFVGNTFGVSPTDSDYSNEYPDLVVDIVGVLDLVGFSWVSDVFIGYSMFPWYVNFLLTGLPLIMIIRGVVSV